MPVPLLGFRGGSGSVSKSPVAVWHLPLALVHVPSKHRRIGWRSPPSILRMELMSGVAFAILSQTRRFPALRVLL